MGRQLLLRLSGRPPTHRVTVRRGMQPPELIKALLRLPPGTMLRSVQGIGRATGTGELRFGDIEEES